MAAAAAGANTTTLRNWYGDTNDRTLTTLEAHFANMPSLAVFRELAHARLSNSSDPWKANDLYDMLMLSCAAAYCDVVVAEKKMGGYLQRLRTGGCKAVTADLHLSLASFIGSL